MKKLFILLFALMTAVYAFAENSAGEAEINKTAQSTPYGVVTLTGEFKTAGQYEIQKGEKLSSIVLRAGGYTADAFLYGTVFTRQSVKTANEAKTASRLAEAGGRDELKSRQATGRFTVSMSHPRLLKGSKNDIELQGGDVIFIPKASEAVQVSGSVKEKGSFTYVQGNSWQDYLKLAGGFADDADKKGVYVLRANGTYFKASKSAVEWSEQKNRWEITAFNKKEPINAGDEIIILDKEALASAEAVMWFFAETK